MKKSIKQKKQYTVHVRARHTVFALQVVMAVHNEALDTAYSFQASKNQ